MTHGMSPKTDSIRNSQGEAFPKGATTQCPLRFWVVHLRKKFLKITWRHVEQREASMCSARSLPLAALELHRHAAHGINISVDIFRPTFLNRQKCTCPLKVWSPSANGNVKNKSIGNRQPLGFCHWNWKAKSSCQIVVLYYCCSAEHDDHFSVKFLSFECKK